MPFIPHTDDEMARMLAAIDASTVTQLFDEIPDTLKPADMSDIPTGLTEQAMARLMQSREPDIDPAKSFIGAGAYHHYIPAAVWQLATRGEFYTAYTPYQAEASQGTLQVIFEYQTMMANLMGMDVSNASLYDGASSLAEAVLMALRIKRSKVTRILIPKHLNPRYRSVLHTILQHHDCQLEDISLNNLPKDTNNLCALIISQPDAVGSIHDTDQLTRWAHQHGALVIACVNPIAMALLKPPGQWGEHGADIACGEGQPLGVPLAGGGPYFGFMCCHKNNVRQLPGRLVGETTDSNNKRGFTLTLQAREQHIRRAKATSNICTNQGLAVTAATIYMTLLGFKGLQAVANNSHAMANLLHQKLSQLPEVTFPFNTPFFHEFVYNTPDNKKTLSQLFHAGIDGGVLTQEGILVCATDTKTEEDIEAYVSALK